MIEHHGTVLWWIALSRLHRKAHGAGGFRLQADGEAEAVDEMHHRQVERLAGVDEFRDLARGGGIPRAAVMQRIAGQDADRPAVEPREAGDDGAAEAAGDLEERALVDHRVDDAPHLVGLLAVTRHDA